MLTSKYGNACLLLLILLGAFALRCWNYDFDPLYDGRPRRGDELKKRMQSLASARGEFRPEKYLQPYYLIHTTGFLIRALSPEDPADPAFLWGLGVFSMIAYSLLTMVVVYRLGRSVFGSSAAGLLAALFLAVVPLNAVGSRYFKEDIPLMLFMNLSILLMLLMVKHGKRVFYVPAGTAIGLSVAVKYAALNLVIFYVAAHALVVALAPREDRLRRLLEWRLAAGLALGIAAFLAFNMHAILDWPGFVAGFRIQLQYAASGHHDGTVITGWEHFWTFYLRQAVLPGVGLPLALAAVAGGIVSLRRRMAPAIFLGAWMFVFYLGLEKSPAKPFPFFARYMHGIAPGLCAFAAFAICEAYRAAGAGARWRRMAVLSGAALCLCLPLVKTCLINHSLGPGRETRHRARAWMAENLAPGSKILVDSRSYGAEPPPEVFDVRRKFHRNLDFIQGRDVDYVVLGSPSYERFEYDKNRGRQADHTYGYYLSVFRECELVREFRPKFRFMTYGFHNPVIGIYRVPKKNG